MYTIYALVDPRTLLIRYIGMTQNHPVERMLQHWANNKGESSPRAVWIAELRMVGNKPFIVALQYAETLDEANERERYWIRQGIAMGWPLLNADNATEKHRTRRNIKQLTTHSSAKTISNHYSEWSDVVSGWFAANPQALTGEVTGISDLARAMAEHRTGKADAYGAYKSRAYRLYHDYRRSHCDEPIPVDVSRPAGGDQK